MAGKKHPHRYKRYKYKTGTEVYFCTLPDCTHKIECVFTLGKESICNRCGEKFIMDEYSIRLAEPHCMNCKISKTDSLPTEVKVTIDTSALADKLLSSISNEKTTDSVSSLRSRLLTSIGKQDVAVSEDDEDFDL